MKFVARRAARAALPAHAKTNPRGPAEVHFPSRPLTVLELRTAKPKPGNDRVPYHWVIEGLGGENLPCSWMNVEGFVVPHQMQFVDLESAQTFLQIFRRLGHPYYGFGPCRVRP